MKLENAAGVNHGQISRIERGSFKTYSKNVQKLCEFLEISGEATSVQADVEGEPLARLLLRLQSFLDKSPEQAPLFATMLETLEAMQARGR